MTGRDTLVPPFIILGLGVARVLLTDIDTVQVELERNVDIGVCTN